MESTFRDPLHPKPRRSLMDSFVQTEICTDRFLFYLGVAVGAVVLGMHTAAISTDKWVFITEPVTVPNKTAMELIKRNINTEAKHLYRKVFLIFNVGYWRLCRRLIPGQKDVNITVRKTWGRSECYTNKFGKFESEFEHPSADKQKKKKKKRKLSDKYLGNVARHIAVRSQYSSTLHMAVLALSACGTALGIIGEQRRKRDPRDRTTLLAAGLHILSVRSQYSSTLHMAVLALSACGTALGIIGEQRRKRDPRDRTTLLAAGLHILSVRSQYSSTLHMAVLALSACGTALGIIGEQRRKRDPRDRTTLLAAGLHILSAIGICTATINFVVVVDDEMATRLRPQADGEKSGFSYEYGWTFFVAAVSFLPMQLVAWCNYRPYLNRFQGALGKMEMVPGWTFFVAAVSFLPMQLVAWCNYRPYLNRFQGALGKMEMVPGLQELWLQKYPDLIARLETAPCQNAYGAERYERKPVAKDIALLVPWASNLLQKIPAGEPRCECGLSEPNSPHRPVSSPRLDAWTKNGYFSDLM